MCIWRYLRWSNNRLKHNTKRKKQLIHCGYLILTSLFYSFEFEERSEIVYKRQFKMINFNGFITIFYIRNLKCDTKWTIFFPLHSTAMCNKSRSGPYLKISFLDLFVFLIHLFFFESKSIRSMGSNVMTVLILFFVCVLSIDCVFKVRITNKYLENVFLFIFNLFLICARWTQWFSHRFYDMVGSVCQMVLKTHKNQDILRFVWCNRNRKRCFLLPQNSNITQNAASRAIGTHV